MKGKISLVKANTSKDSKLTIYKASKKGKRQK